MFCGWDWGSTQHGVCVVDDHGTVVGRWLIEHTESALARLFVELGELTVATTLPIAIERGEGLIVGAIAGLDAAEADLLRVAPPSFVLGQMPSVLNAAQRHLKASDPRRAEL